MRDFAFEMYITEAQIKELRERLKVTVGEQPIQFLTMLLQEAEDKLRLLEAERDSCARPRP